MHISTEVFIYCFIGIIFLIYSISYAIAEAKAIKSTKKWYLKYKNMLEHTASETKQSYPWVSEQFANILYAFDEEIARELRWKKHPARKTSEHVSLIAKEKRELLKQNKMMQYQLHYYETLFPWLEDFKEVDPKDGWNYTHEITGTETSEYDSIKEWLSPEEYQKLTTVDKYQLLLDRYMTRKKNNWEVGIDYERFIGYIYESKGYKVYYNGALKGLEDMGRDLIAENGSEILVIQCKRWAHEKIIHEKHIFQLFGTTMLMRIKNPNKNYRGLFITTAKLSDLSKTCANYLNIEVIENYQMQAYPMVKCNVTPKKEKIYHLPLDQQYDKVQIVNKAGAMFVRTVKEAEELGYRRAYRWRPTSTAT